MSETRTEYAVKSTQTRHGRRQAIIEPIPGHETDRAWNEQAVKQEREWQASVGLTPDAELVTRTVTVTEWCSADGQALPLDECSEHEYLDEVERRDAAEIAELLDLGV